jgi:hypothetical protein
VGVAAYAVAVSDAAAAPVNDVVHVVALHSGFQVAGCRMMLSHVLQLLVQFLFKLLL